LSVLTPHLEILPEAQRRLWPSLAGLAEAGFVLYGGTAIALRCGHRVSVDFDFFSDRPLDRQQLSRELPWLDSARVLQDQPETLTVLSPALELENAIKVSFFGGLAIGRVGVPQISADGVALVASPLDLLATKLKVLLQRAKARTTRMWLYCWAAACRWPRVWAQPERLMAPSSPRANASRPWWFSPMVIWLSWA